MPGFAGDAGDVGTMVVGQSKGLGVQLKSAFFSGMSVPLSVQGGPSGPVGYREGARVGAAVAGQSWSRLGPCRPLLLTECVFQVHLWERMAPKGDSRQMPWFPILVVSGSEQRPALHPWLERARVPSGRLQQGPPPGLCPSPDTLPWAASLASYASVCKVLNGNIAEILWGCRDNVCSSLNSARGVNRTSPVGGSLHRFHG